MVKKILIGIALVIVAIQFYRPARNESGEHSKDFSNKYPVPEEVANILAVACNDCHTNKTNYPWYANIQPIGLWMNGHIEDGKRHLNFSTYLSRNIAYQNHKFEDFVEQLEEKEMPLPSYTYLGMHPEANLTEDQRQLLIRWAKVQMDTLKAQYPPDSLILRRRTPPPGQ